MDLMFPVTLGQSLILTFHYESLKKLDLVTAAIDGGFNRNITERRRAPNDALESGDCSPRPA